MLNGIELNEEDENDASSEQDKSNEEEVNKRLRDASEKVGGNENTVAHKSILQGSKKRRLAHMTKSVVNGVHEDKKVLKKLPYKPANEATSK